MYPILAKINKIILPSFTKRQLDISKAKKWQMAIIGYRAFVTKRALGNQFKIKTFFNIPLAKTNSITIFAPTKKASWRN